MSTRRKLLAGATAALSLQLATSRVTAQQWSRAPAIVPPHPDPADFEAALRAKFATGDMLNWTGGNVRLRRPIAIDVTTNMLGPGVDLNGAKLIADFDDPRQNAITIRIPATASKVSLRGMKFCNGVIVAGSPAQDAIALICATNQSWIYSWKFMNLDVGGFARDGLSFNGSVFEGECHAVTCADNGRNGMTFRNDGPRDDLGIVSAISIFGGQLRTNGNAGIETQSVIPYEEPRDLNISQTYFVENKGPGLHATAGLSMAMGCGFENNGECGIKLMNEGRLYACRASTYGTQPYLVEAYLNDGDLLLDGCRVEGYSGFENKMKLAKISGKGLVSMRFSGDRSNLDLSGNIDVKTT